MAKPTEEQLELESLRKEALSYGYALEGDDLEELQLAIERLREERGGKPPCYRRSYSSIAPQCRVCDLASDCSGTAVPAYVPPDELQQAQCLRCNQGLLRVELYDEATQAILDYACSAPGCTNTLLAQERWKSAGPTPSDVYGLEVEGDTVDETPRLTGQAISQLRKDRRSSPYQSSNASEIPVEVIDERIIEAVTANQPVRKVRLIEIVGGDHPSPTRIDKRIAMMVQCGRIRKAADGFRINEEGEED